MFNLNKTPKAIQLAAEKTPGMRIVCVNGDSPEISIMDYIGSDGWGGGIAAADVRTFLNANKGREVNARFNSFGGSAYEGLVMHNAFAEHGNVTGVIDGIAFSAAAIAIAGANKVVMNEASNFGIHHALTIVYGNSKEMAAAIEWLNAVDEHQFTIFMNKTGASREQVAEWMSGTDDGTVFSSAEALAAGFADEVIPLKKAAEAKQQATAVAYNRIAAEIRHKLVASRKV